MIFRACTETILYAGTQRANTPRKVRLYPKWKRPNQLDARREHQLGLCWNSLHALFIVESRLSDCTHFCHPRISSYSQADAGEARDRNIILLDVTELTVWRQE